MTAVARLLDHWRATGSKHRPGASPLDIDRFERRYGVVLPAVVRELFLAADGTGEDYDDSFCRFYPLADVKPVGEEIAGCPDAGAYPDCYVFAEWAIWCWGYAVRLTADPAQPAPVFRVTCSEARGPEVASSLAWFLERYLDTPGSPP